MNKLTLHNTQIKILLWLFIINSTVMVIPTSAQQNNRDKFLVDTISRYSSPTNYASVAFIYDDNNKLIKRIMTGKRIQNNQVIDIKSAYVFEYENNRVSKIRYFRPINSTFSRYDFHLHYDTEGKLIRKETWINQSMMGARNYHYENGHVVSTYNDTSLPFETDSIFYNELDNITKFVHIIPVFDIIGEPIPGEFEVRELYFEYDNHPTPNFNLDYLFDFDFIPWLGDYFPRIIRYASKNNVTQSHYNNLTYLYTYNEHGLVKTMQAIDSKEKISRGVLSFSYKEIENDNIPEVAGNSNINIYPNPAKNKIIVDCDFTGTIKFYDMTGREMLSKDLIEKTNINISSLSNGIYHIIIFSENNMIGKRKIIKY